jgi:hypothetical protein
MPPKTKQPHQATLTLDTLGQLAAGQAEATINAALRAALRDTEDRGADKKARKVVIEIVLEKLSPDVVKATVRAKSVLPPYVTDPTIGELQPGERGQPEMAFAPAAPSNPHQANLPGTE